ncbi:hypothetical protein S7711_11057 [Stachybotrys chartarum IBT 7711]|uniref:Uncharacterized protein n=1 Tax=Stachybotrys chartarum (strain CBS 109288 / IBT 7711) TaxID=1280523 RepID=A0A084AYR4_STACB|nr:hypothetical protein S7711_11057 [Stachybotrys chartarum IBT 7711]
MPGTKPKSTSALASCSHLSTWGAVATRFLRSLSSSFLFRLKVPRPSSTRPPSVLLLQPSSTSHPSLCFTPEPSSITTNLAYSHEETKFPSGMGPPGAFLFPFVHSF